MILLLSSVRTLNYDRSDDTGKTIVIAQLRSLHALLIHETNIRVRIAFQTKLGDIG